MNEKITNKTIVQIALVAGIVTLASLSVNGWGWLVFALLVTL
jgi:hypothetical protein